MAALHPAISVGQVSPAAAYFQTRDNRVFVLYAVRYGLAELENVVVRIDNSNKLKTNKDVCTSIQQQMLTSSFYFLLVCSILYLLIESTFLNFNHPSETASDVDAIRLVTLECEILNYFVT